MGRRNFLEVDADGTIGPLAARPAGTVAGWNGTALRTAGAAQALHTLALLHTCMYNAWAAYDGAARQTALGVAVRLPRAARAPASRTAALNHAAHGILAGLFPETRADLDPAAAAAEALRRFTGGSLLDAAASEAGRKVGARVFDKARRYWQGKL